MDNFREIQYWRLPHGPRKYDRIEPIGCVTFDGNPPNVLGRPIPGNWSLVKFFDRTKLTKLEEMGNAHIYGYL